MKPVLLVFGLLLTLSALAQRPANPPMPRPVFVPRPAAGYVPPIQYQFHNGVASLTDGSSLTGRFQYNGYAAFFYHESPVSARRKLYFGLIQRLTLTGADTAAVGRTDSTVFVRMNRSLYRQLTPDAAPLYDRVYTINESPGKIGAVVFAPDASARLRRLESLKS